MTVAALEVEHAYRECEQITRREAANFYYGIRLLPKLKRQAMCAVYAFARRVDDIGDADREPRDQESQLEALAAERTMLAALADGVPTTSDSVSVALHDARTHYDLPIDALELLVDGVEQDVRGTEYETFDELVGYCRCVAGAVGRLCVAIFNDGAGNGVAELADDLGVAMQLTNILRDVVEDSQLGRTYLPAEDLRRFGWVDLDSVSEHDAVELIRFEAARAGEWFDRGLRLTDSLDRRSASCVQAMTGIYQRILERIVQDPTRVLRGRISLSPWEKTWVAARSLAGAGGMGRR